VSSRQRGASNDAPVIVKGHFHVANDTKAGAVRWDQQLSEHKVPALTAAREPHRPPPGNVIPHFRRGEQPFDPEP
jgi:hypothetical protein